MPTVTPPLPSLKDRLVAAIDKLEIVHTLTDAEELTLFRQLRHMASRLSLHQAIIVEPISMALAPRDGTLIDIYAKRYDPATDKFTYVRLADAYWVKDPKISADGYWTCIGLNGANMAAGLRPLYWVRRLDVEECAELCH